MRLATSGMAVIGVLALGLSALGLPAMAASSSEVTVEDRVDWHVVGAGETLERITERYLGTTALWYENWKLNPQVKDPNLLHPGDRLRIIVERQVPARRAAIREIANDVDKNPERRGWEDAHRGDELEAPSGIRTAGGSSARVAFDEVSEVVLTEHTQIFLKEMTTSVTGVRRGAIEIERGQADLAMNVQRPDRTNIEIVMGDTVARPRPGSSGRAETRARKGGDGGAALMVYGGTSQVEASGVTVAVPRGMGTTVPEGGAPTPPERLVAAPALDAPARDERFAYSNPRFSWRGVEGAVRYTIEICADTACASLVVRATDVTGTSWQPSYLPAATHFWRVTAVSDSGLDGYPSRTRRVVVDLPDADAPQWADRAPPTVVATVIGAGRAEGDGTLVLGASATIRLAARDDAAGVDTVRYRWDDGAWRTWRGRDLSPPRGGVAHVLTVDATDTLGQRAESWSVEVRRDAESPAVPSAKRRGRSR